MRSNSTETLGGEGRDVAALPPLLTWISTVLSIVRPPLKNFFRQASKTQRERVRVRLHGFCRCDTVGLRVIPSGKIILLLDAGHYSTQSVL